ncbi:MAG: hypothetical protein H6672_04995 [Anaerolineaceae bacterium]|nr:hypothetical protein [Anaerolineaceae bacterium]
MSATTLLFLVGLACLFTHELDAIQQHEWRFFFASSSFSDTTAYGLFAAAHVPLFVLIVANWESSAFQVGLDVFLVIHAGLHTLLRKHPLLTFNSGFSRLWIYGGAVCGAAHLALLTAT